jgi:hypothetical protein
MTDTTTDYRDLLVRYMAVVIHMAGVPFYGRNEIMGCFTEAEMRILDYIDLEARKLTIKKQTP